MIKDQICNPNAPKLMIKNPKKIHKILFIIFHCFWCIWIIYLIFNYCILNFCNEVDPLWPEKAGLEFQAKHFYQIF